MLRRIFFGGVFLFLGAIFLFIGGSTFLEEQRYQQRGVRAPAVVTGKALRVATAHSATAYEISYRVNPAEGTPFEQTESASVHLWERVERGSPLMVEYVPAQSESARVVLERSDQTTEMAFALSTGGVLALIGVFVIVKGGRWLSSSATAPAVTEPVEVALGAAVANQRSFWPLARRSFGFWFGGIALLIGLPWFVVNGVFPFYNDWRFAQEGLSTTGIVLTKEIRSSGRGSNRTQHYEVTYRFEVSGDPIEGRDELSLEDWEQLVERESADVLYRPGKPSSNRLAGDRPWVSQTFFGLLGLVFAVVGSTVFVRAVRNARLVWHLRQNGVRTQGTVTELQDLKLKLNGAQQWRLQYEYRDFQGHPHLKTFDMPQNEAQTWTAGDVGAVLYDSTRPTEAMWLGREKT
ncbi:MAG: DUF3592 domain-containing protein [Acidobacteria bacterium]|nr:DUF3592 domain-containing protein [Acidobacteriota bacterium]